MNILILDMTHGGDILAEEYIGRGHSVTCADVYGMATDDRIRELTEIGASVCRTAAGSYDLAVMPAHCPDVFLKGASYGRRITFSRAVGELIGDRRPRIEVTGVKGKTSSCYLLAHILSCSGKKVFLHTSRGQGPYAGGAHDIRKSMSIAPTSLLRLPEGDFDHIVAEVSLGGSGRADIAAITNLAEDYGIAGNTGKASDAKADILTERINIVHINETRIWERYGGHDLSAYGDNVHIVNAPRLGEPLEIAFEYNGPWRVTLDARYLSVQYVQAIDLAVAVCGILGIPADAVTEGLRTFTGVPGRGEISFRCGRWYVLDRNPGISAASIRMTLGCLRDMGALDGAFVIIDPVSKKVCDKLDTDDILGIASEFGVRPHITDGTGNIPEIPDGTRTVVTFVKEGFQ
ncbi:MAG: coenzyme F430 synthase [Methanomassiliicoccaceae archaeon]|jgi:hypothetical protein|nr:coenzyme F430 synthase [Methanomassiliicoccaceae archaeon]